MPSSNPYRIQQVSVDFHAQVEPLLKRLVEEAAINNMKVVSHSIYVNPENTTCVVSLITKTKGH